MAHFSDFTFTFNLIYAFSASQLQSLCASCIKMHRFETKIQKKNRPIPVPARGLLRAYNVRI